VAFPTVSCALIICESIMQAVGCAARPWCARSSSRGRVMTACGRPRQDRDHRPTCGDGELAHHIPQRHAAQRPNRDAYTMIARLTPFIHKL
jgi:hypothetical protein